MIQFLKDEDHEKMRGILHKMRRSRWETLNKTMEKVTIVGGTPR